CGAWRGGLILGKRFHAFDQIALFAVGQSQIEDGIVMIDHVQERRKAAIVVEARLLKGENLSHMGPKASQRRRAVTSVRCRFAWKSSMPISSAVCRFQPGSDQS